MAPTQFVTQCVPNCKTTVKLAHFTKFSFIKPLSEFNSKFLRKFLQNLFSVFGSLPFQFILLFLSYANIMNDFTIHYENDINSAL